MINHTMLAENATSVTSTLYAKASRVMYSIPNVIQMAVNNSTTAAPISASISRRTAATKITSSLNSISDNVQPKTKPYFNTKRRLTSINRNTHKISNSAEKNIPRRPNKLHAK